VIILGWFKLKKLLLRKRELIANRSQHINKIVMSIFGPAPLRLRSSYIA